MSSPLTIINPNDRNWTRHRFVLSFGAHAPTHLMVYANSLDDALEECGEWLLEHEPGHFHDPDYSGVATEKACTQCIPNEVFCDDCQQVAVTDMTYTESGWLLSWEWSITLEDPSRAEIKAFISELEKRHYSDDPVVAVNV